MKRIKAAWSFIATEFSYVWTWITTVKNSSGRTVKLLHLEPGELRELASDARKCILALAITLAFFPPIIWFERSRTASANIYMITEDVCPHGSWLKPKYITLGEPLVLHQPGLAATTFSEEAIPSREVRSVKLESGLFWDSVVLEREHAKSIVLCFRKKDKDSVSALAYEILEQRIH